MAGFILLCNLQIQHVSAFLSKQRLAHDDTTQTATSLNFRTVKHARSRLASLDRKQVRVALLAVASHSQACVLSQMLVMPDTCHAGLESVLHLAYNTLSAANSIFVIDKKHTLQVLIADRLEASSRREQMCHQQLECQAVSLSGRQVGYNHF